MKYRETEGIKDVKSATIEGFKESNFEKFSNYADRYNYDGFAVVSDLTKIQRPANPTSIGSSWGGAPIRLQALVGGAWKTVSIPGTWKDCTTWDDYYKLNGQSYYGYTAGSKGKVVKETEKVTVLGRSGSTATQNFAFDIDAEDYE